MTKFGIVTYMGEEPVLGISHAHILKGQDPSVPQIFWDLLHVRTQYEKQQPNHA